MELEGSTARRLTSPVGLRLVAELTQRLDAGEDELGIVARFGAQLDDPAFGRAALSVATARRRARPRWPDADQLLFTPEALEQASDPVVSAWRARRFPVDHRVFDLCAGVGGDTLALAGERSVTAVDQAAGRLELLRHNAAVRDLDVGIVAADVLGVAVPEDTFVHADPGRRHEGRRVRRLSAYLPSVPELVARIRDGPGYAVAVAPGVDHDDPGLPSDVEVEYLQVEDRLVEAVLWGGALRAGQTTASATLLPSGEHLQRQGPRPPRLTIGEVRDHLVQIQPAAVRARLHDVVAARLAADGRSVWRLAGRRALFTLAGPPPPTDPWYRARPVVTVLPARPKSVRAWLRRADAGPVEIVLHGYDAEPGQLWRAIGRPPRGPAGLRLEWVRLDAASIVVVTDDGAPRAGRPVIDS